jgi:carboxylesterase type B
MAGKWTGILNTTTSTTGCMTLDFSSPDLPPIGREDCLDLDIYVPHVSNYQIIKCQASPQLNVM